MFDKFLAFQMLVRSFSIYWFGCKITFHIVFDRLGKSPVSQIKTELQILSKCLKIFKDKCKDRLGVCSM